jgi:hypothetical protein
VGDGTYGGENRIKTQGVFGGNKQRLAPGYKAFFFAGMQKNNQ